MRRLSALIALVAPLLFCVPAVHATPFFATLTGPAEDPPNSSPGTGTAFVDFDVVAHTMHVVASFSGLTAPTTAAHIHGPTAVPGVGKAGVATEVPFFDGFPIGVTSGSYDETFDTLADSTYNSAFITANGGTAAAAEAALFASLLGGTAYFNIHTSAFTGGEIRGFLGAVSAVSAPGALVLLVTGVTGLFAAARIRRG